MRAMHMQLSMLTGLGLFCGLSFAADAATSAGVTARNSGPGVATATAQYTGDAGYARTSSHSGDVSRARGIAVGVDENGLAISLSNAVEHNGLALATNFNINIGRDGDVSTSSGLALGRGGSQREAAVVGSAGHNRPALSIANARTERGGVAQVVTRAEQRPARPERVIVRRVRPR